MKKQTKIMGLIAAGVLLVGSAASAYGLNTAADTTEKTGRISITSEEGTTEGRGMGMTGEKEAGRGGQKGQSSEGIVEILAPLEEDGTLDSDTVEAIEEYISEAAIAAQEEKEAQKEALEEMTEEEKEAYFEEKKAEREASQDEEKTSILDEMVDDGIITEDQLEAILEVLPMQNAQGGNREGGKGPQSGNAEGSEGVEGEGGPQGQGGMNAEGGIGAQGGMNAQGGQRR